MKVLYGNNKNLKNVNAVLVGNPNCGKTTLFNRLTGSKQRTGNWAGVTVEKKTGIVKCANGGRIELTDLPGTYSLSPYSPEEAVVRDCLSGNHPDVIINIVDATSLERNLYLTTQLAELGIPIVIALNMYDLATKDGGRIDYALIESRLHIPVVPISAGKNKGINSLIKSVLKACDNPRPNIMQRKFRNAEERYQYIQAVTKNAIIPPNRNKTGSLTIKADKILTNRFLAIPIFMSVIFAVFTITFGSFGTLLRDGAEYLICDLLKNSVKALLDYLNTSEWAQSLVLDGIIGGVGAVVSFLPQLVLLFTLLSLLEDSGYMARAAFITDRPLRKIGLSGKAFVPLIMGFGCSVPAILAARTLESSREKRLTVLLTPFMSCSAKMPVYLMLASAFFRESAAFVIFALYLIGIAVAFITALFFKKSSQKSEMPFVMEIPPYRLPSPKSLWLHVWKRTSDFLMRAGTVLLSASILIWFLQSFDFSMKTVNADSSILASVGRLIAPVFSVCGFGDWKASVSIVAGIAAKESVASTLMVLLSGAELSSVFNPLSAFSFLVFILLCPPCIGAILAVHREMHSAKWTVFSVLYQLFVAWFLSACIFQFGTFFINVI